MEDYDANYTHKIFLDINLTKTQYNNRENDKNV